MGPWRAAQRFLAEMSPSDRAQIQRITIELFGSLAKTGKGHGTDIAVQLGLSGEDPETIRVAAIQARVQEIARTKRLSLSGEVNIEFDPRASIIFHADQQLPYHPNALRFMAWLADSKRIEAEFYSIGGGFIVREHEVSGTSSADLPYPIESAAQLLVYCQNEGCRISDIVSKRWPNNNCRISIVAITLRVMIRSKTGQLLFGRC
jgi:L-serine dehydratase